MLDKPRPARHPAGHLGAALLTVAAAGIVVAAQDTAKSTNEGVYTAEQAGRGAGFFESRCTACHDTARFTGSIFLDSWNGQPLHALFDLMQATMPEDNPGSLKPQQYADVLSYFLSLNGYPAGETELEGTSEALMAIRLVPPASAEKAPPRR